MGVYILAYTPIESKKKSPDFSGRYVIDWRRTPGIGGYSPAFRIKEKCREIEAFWAAKKATIPPAGAKRALYDRLVNKGSEGTYSSSEYGRAVDCLFFGAGVDRPPLYEDDQLCDFVGGLIEESAQKEHVRSWCRSVFQIWPAENPAVLERLLIRTRRLTGENSAAVNSAVISLMEVEAPARVGLSVPEGKELEDFVLEESDKLAARYSGFTSEVWRQGLGRYTHLIEAAENDVEATQAALKLIESESMLPYHRFRDLREADAFARAVLEPYTFGSGQLPSLELQNHFWRFFERIFGETDDPASRHAWNRISEDLKKLIKHWKQGRALIASLDLVELLAARYGKGDASANIHSEERVSFWRKVWNTGLVTSCKVFVPNSRLGCPEVYEYENKGVLIGNAGSENAGKSVIAMTLKRSVLVAEISYQGALRIVDLRTHPSADITKKSCLSPRWRSSFSVIGIQVNHTNGWHQRATRALNDALGFNVL